MSKLVVAVSVLSTCSLHLQLTDCARLLAQINCKIVVEEEKIKLIAHYNCLRNEPDSNPFATINADTPARLSIPDRTAALETRNTHGKVSAA